MADHPNIFVIYCLIVHIAVNTANAKVSACDSTIRAPNPQEKTKRLYFCSLIIIIISSSPIIITRQEQMGPRSQLFDCYRLRSLNAH